MKERIYKIIFPSKLWAPNITLLHTDLHFDNYLNYKIGTW